MKPVMSGSSQMTLSVMTVVRITDPRGLLKVKWNTYIGYFRNTGKLF